MRLKIDIEDLRAELANHKNKVQELTVSINALQANQMFSLKQIDLIEQILNGWEGLK